MQFLVAEAKFCELFALTDTRFLSLIRFSEMSRLVVQRSINTSGAFSGFCNRGPHVRLTTPHLAKLPSSLSGWMLDKSSTHMNSQHVRPARDVDISVGSASMFFYFPLRSR